MRSTRSSVPRSVTAWRGSASAIRSATPRPTAQKRGATWLADRVYSGVPAGEFGKEQEIEIGFMSGQANVGFWLEKRHIAPEPALVAAILDRAKRSNRILTEQEVMEVVRTH